MTSADIPPDAACRACRRAAERLAELEEQLAAAGLTPELSALLAQVQAALNGADLRTHLLRVAAERDQLSAKLDALIARDNLARHLAGRVHELSDKLIQVSDMLVRLGDRCRGQSELLARAGERAGDERRRCAEIARQYGAVKVALAIEAINPV